MTKGAKYKMTFCIEKEYKINNQCYEMMEARAVNDIMKELNIPDDDFVKTRNLMKKYIKFEPLIEEDTEEDIERQEKALKGKDKTQKQDGNLTGDNFDDFHLKQQLVAFMTRNIDEISVRDLIRIVNGFQECMGQAEIYRTTQESMEQADEED